MWNAVLIKKNIMLADQQAMKPQQTISEVMTALRPAAFSAELAPMVT